MKYGVVWCLAVTSILTCPCLGEFAVNTRTSDGQTDAAVAMDANENFVVVWSSYRGDGDSGAIFGRRFDANCGPVGDEFQINTTTAGNQTEPAVAMEPNGNFVVVWHGPGVREKGKRRLNIEYRTPRESIGASKEWRMMKYMRRPDPSTPLRFAPWAQAQDDFMKARASCCG